MKAKFSAVFLKLIGGLGKNISRFIRSWLTEFRGDSNDLFW